MAYLSQEIKNNHCSGIDTARQCGVLHRATYRTIENHSHRLESPASVLPPAVGNRESQLTNDSGRWSRVSQAGEGNTINENDHEIVTRKRSLMETLTVDQEVI
jgi:hypothetical protein